MRPIRQATRWRWAIRATKGATHRRRPSAEFGRRENNFAEKNFELLFSDDFFILVIDFFCLFLSLCCLTWSHIFHLQYVTHIILYHSFLDENVYFAKKSVFSVRTCDNITSPDIGRRMHGPSPTSNLGGPSPIPPQVSAHGATPPESSSSDPICWLQKRGCSVTRRRAGNNPQLAKPSDHPERTSL